MLVLEDYEHAKAHPFLKPELGMPPEAINGSPVGKHFKSGLRVYPGEDHQRQSRTHCSSAPFF